MHNYIGIILFSCILFILSCESDDKDEAEVEGGRLYTLNHGIFHTRVASDEFGATNYGFDAMATASDAFISIENDKSNAFLLLAARNSIEKYRVRSNGDITLERGSVFDIPNPGNPGHRICAVRYTVTSGGTVGSQDLLIERRIQSMQDGSFTWFELRALAAEDAGNFGWDDGTFDKPITLEAKVYIKTILPSVDMYKLYGSTAEFTEIETFFNGVLSQAVCQVENINVEENNEITNKPWDLNGNGKLDIYPDDPENTGDETYEIAEWAYYESIWSESEIGGVVLEQDFEIHNAGGIPIYGISMDNFIVLPPNYEQRVFCHEYLHCPLAADLNDNTDEYNLMCYSNDFGYNWLRYRNVTLVSGGTERQWEKLSKQNY